MIYPALLVIAGTVLLASCVPDAPPPQPLPAPDCRVTRVIDGDTVDMVCGSDRFRARLTGYDTPETHEPGCAAEARAGAEATARLRRMVAAGGPVVADLGGTDRYGRRLVALSLGGADVGRVLIAEGLAVPYRGGRRINWCQRLG